MTCVWRCTQQFRGLHIRLPSFILCLFATAGLSTDTIKSTLATVKGRGQAARHAATLEALQTSHTASVTAQEAVRPGLTALQVEAVQGFIKAEKKSASLAEGGWVAALPWLLVTAYTTITASCMYIIHTCARFMTSQFHMISLAISSLAVCNQGCGAARNYLLLNAI